MTDREIMPYFASYVRVKKSGKYDMQSQEAYNAVKNRINCLTPELTWEVYMEIVNNYTKLSNRFIDIVEKIEDEIYFLGNDVD